MIQKTFGNTRVIQVEKTVSNCKCGNNAVIMIENNNKNSHYCRQCARKEWLNMAKKYE